MYVLVEDVSEHYYAERTSEFGSFSELLEHLLRNTKTEIERVYDVREAFTESDVKAHLNAYKVEKARLREQALAKLTPEERLALGLN